MVEFYVSGEPEKTPVKENSFYALFDDETWNRVKCLKTENSVAVVRFIDRGDINSYPVQKLLKLDYKFCFLPAQAVKMTLSNLETFSECDNMQSIIQKSLLKKIFHAKVEKVVEKNCLSVKLYQDKGRTISINDVIKREACKQSMTRRYSTAKTDEKFSPLQSTSGLSPEAVPFIPESVKVAETILRVPKKDMNPVVA